MGFNKIVSELCLIFLTSTWPHPPEIGVPPRTGHRYVAHPKRGIQPHFTLPTFFTFHASQPSNSKPTRVKHRQSMATTHFDNHVLVDSSDVDETTALLSSDAAIRRNRRRTNSHSSVTSSIYKCADDHEKLNSTRETERNKRRLWMATALSICFFALELVAGIWSHSLALLSDSFHLLSDVAGFGISLAALYLAQMPATKRHSFGFHRAEILGTMVRSSANPVSQSSLIWPMRLTMVAVSFPHLGVDGCPRVRSN